MLRRAFSSIHAIRGRGGEGGSDVIMENLDRLWSVRSGKTIVTETSKHGLRIFSNNLMELFDRRMVRGWKVV